MGVLHADMVMKSIIPVVMAGVLGIYGLIVAVLLGASIDGKDPYNVSLYSAIAVGQEMCPASAPFFAFMGCAAALVFACLGAAYGTAKSGVGVANMGVLHADMVMKSIMPVSAVAWQASPPGLPSA